MPISTCKGDEGQTDLLFGHRVSKLHPRVVACGEIDELNAQLGLARSLGLNLQNAALVDRVQRELFSLMGQLATLPEDQARYEKAGFASLTQESLDRLTEESRSLELEVGKLTDWAIPGAKGVASAAALDVARTVARRAERAVISVLQNDAKNQWLIAYLNRLSDVLWLLARAEENGEKQA